MSADASLPGLVPTAQQMSAVVIEQETMAANTYRLRLRCPELAKQIRPGQFFMVKEPGTNDPLLGRPFALFDVWEENGEPAGVDFGYVAIGKLTNLMTHWSPGDPVQLWGPLGNGFPEPGNGHLMMVAGGIGQTPFLAVAREALGLRTYGTPARQLDVKPSKLTLAYGVRSEEYLAGIDEFTIEGLDLRIATDNGTAGHHGFVTQLLLDAIQSNAPPDKVYCCGPEPMMEVVQEICLRESVSCWLSLESPMACGFGACFSCVVPIRQEDGNWDYKRSCVEGPVFPAETLIFEH